MAGQESEDAENKALETNEDQTDTVETSGDSGATLGGAIAAQARRFCSPHTAVPKEWAEGGKYPLLYGPYGLSSFAYSVLGIWIMAAFAYDDLSVFGTPPIVDGLMLFVQGLVSYGCDVYTFGYSSVFKILDRGEALITMAWWTAKLFYLNIAPQCVSMNAAEIVVFLVTGVIAICCKVKGEMAMRKLDWTAFRVWHSLWHLSAPLGLFVWALMRKNRT